MNLGRNSKLDSISNSRQLGERIRDTILSNKVECDAPDFGLHYFFLSRYVVTPRRSNVTFMIRVAWRGLACYNTLIHTGNVYFCETMLKMPNFQQDRHCSALFIYRTHAKLGVHLLPRFDEGVIENPYMHKGRAAWLAAWLGFACLRSRSSPSTSPQSLSVGRLSLNAKQSDP